MTSYMENLELKIKLQQLEAENKLLKDELQKLAELKIQKQSDYITAFQEVENKMDSEEIIAEERKLHSKGLQSKKNKRS